MSKVSLAGIKESMYIIFNSKNQFQKKKILLLYDVAFGLLEKSVLYIVEV